MKNIFKYNKWIILIMVILVTTSCEKDFMDVNHDPSRSPESTVQFSLHKPMSQRQQEM
jgi:hypothetical protein